MSWYVIGTLTARGAEVVSVPYETHGDRVVFTVDDYLAAKGDLYRSRLLSEISLEEIVDDITLLVRLTEWFDLYRYS